MDLLSHPSSRTRLLVVAASLLATVGCQKEETARAAAPTAGQQPRQVRLVPAQERAVSRAIEVSGTLAAEDQVVLGMKVTGRVSELLVDLGSRVQKGQAIAKLDPTDLQLNVEQAEAAIQQARTRLGLSPNGEQDRVDASRTSVARQAQATLNEAKLNRDRAQKLLDQKLIARSEFDSAVAAFQLAEARYQDAFDEIRNRQAILVQRRSELALARQQLADAVLRAPIDGAVAERQASVGQYLQVGAPVVTLVKLHPLRLRLPVPERAAAAIRVGQPVRVTTDEDQAVRQGRIARLSPSIQEANRTLLVEAEVPNLDGRLRPGAFARAEIVTQSGQPALFVPASAVVTFAGIEKVLMVDKGRSVEKSIRTGRRDGTEVEVAEGLKPGDQVVVRPGNLVGGQPVTVAR